jgi:urease accessory protein
MSEGRPSSTSLLALLQLTDSFFPTGMFAHSLGLEGMVRRGRVKTLADLEQIILSTLTHAVIPSDCVALVNAHRAHRAGALDELVGIDRRLVLMKIAPELRLASQQHGRRLLAESVAFSDDRIVGAYRSRVLQRMVPGTGAVALGAVTSALDIGADLALAGYVHGYATGVVSAAIRLLPISNTDCQGLMFRVQGAIQDDLELVHAHPWRAMTAFTPELDIASMGHVHDDLRMFAS